MAKKTKVIEARAMRGMRARIRFVSPDTGIDSGRKAFCDAINAALCAFHIGSGTYRVTIEAEPDRKERV